MRLPESCAKVTDRVEKHSAKLFACREIRIKFVRKDRGKTAIYYTMITECKRVELAPFAWLTHVFRALPTHKEEKSLLLSLMPEACAQRQKNEKAKINRA